ncbi:endonuclease/exonuclease/phosphatase family protein [Streptacidiphilus cavernicola]|uniref:Endonuclease/exonuclease/phosphatase family protein n=1 Tax=Streptacidiphilus cavernicola TaxID=3342716 RepID=A0ABV6VY80_9ACTN
MTVQLRIGTYNIHEAEGDLAEAQIAMLAEHGLDVLCIQEAGGTGWMESPDPHEYTGTGPVLKRYCEGLGMDGIAARSRADHRHTALLWRRGRIRSEGINDYSCIAHRTFAQHRLDVDGIGVVCAMSVHGHNANGESRYSEAQHMARLAAPSGRAVAAGDWNAVHGRPAGALWAHLGEPDEEPDITRLPDYMLASQALLDHAGDPVLDESGQPVFDRRASKVLGVGGFREVAAELLPPHERQQTGAFLHRDAPRRLDRVYTYGLRPVSTETVADPQADLSDHYLVIATVSA